MTESILKAVLRLFAIVSQLLEENKIDDAESIVESYLRQLVSNDKVNQYLYIYRFYNKDFVERRKKKIREKDSLFTIKALIICEQINKVLIQRQKVLILLQMLEILSIKENLTSDDIDIIKTLALALHFNESVYHSCKSFVLDSYAEIDDRENLLVIDGAEKSSIPEIQHLQKKKLKGKIVFIRISHTSSYVFRYIEYNDQLYLNGRNILPNRSYIFEKGSFIHSPIFGSLHHSDIVRQFLKTGTDLIVLAAHEVEFRFKNSRKGIMEFSLVEENGQMIGIMGGSGTGKSTLMNLLNGNLKPKSGKVTINGFDVHHEKSKLKGIIGYIPQDDLLIEELTVFENLYYNAMLCFKDLDHEKIVDKVDKTLTDLGLYESRNLKVGTPLNKFISGGQRKRLNISLELIREPYVLFVDEPTSGLSSTDSEVVMDLLKEHALSGKLVIVTIHQPSSDIFKLFDKLIITDQDGQVIYNGNPIESPVYFKSHNQLINAESGECMTCGNLNPEQILQIVEAKTVDDSGHYTENRITTPDEWYDRYKKNIEPQSRNYHDTKINLPVSHFSIPGKFRQFIIFSIRNLKTKIADRQYLVINLLEAPLLALILGIFTRYNKGTDTDPYAYIFSENLNLPVYIFMAVIVSLFLGMMVSAEEIIRDRRIIRRESFLSLSTFSYYNSKAVYLILLSAFQSFVFVLIGNRILGIREMFMIYWFMLFTLSVFSNLVGLNISDNLKSVVAIYIVIPLLLVPQILLGGAMVKFDKLNKRITTQKYVPIIGDVIPARWAYEALMVHQFRYNAFERQVYDTEREESDASFNINYKIPEMKSMLDEYLLKSTGEEKKTQTNNLTIIYNEFKNIATFNTAIPEFNQTEDLLQDPLRFETVERIYAYLDRLKKYYSKVLKNAVTEKDRILKKMEHSFGGNERLVAFRQRYHNESVAEIVMNKRETEKIIRYISELIRKAEPVFQMPENRYGRAQFYTPVKRLGNFVIETYWFNVLILWIMNVFLFICLQTGILRYMSNKIGKSS